MVHRFLRSQCHIPRRICRDVSLDQLARGSIALESFAESMNSLDANLVSAWRRDNVGLALLRPYMILDHVHTTTRHCRQPDRYYGDSISPSKTS